MATTLRYLRLNEQFFVFPRRAPYMGATHALLRDAADDATDTARIERERIVAQLCVDLIERYGYRLSQLHVRELVPIVSTEGWKYPEVDLLIEGKDGNPRLLIKAFSPEEYDTSLEQGLDELFVLARGATHALLPSRRTTPLFIIPYTRRLERQRVRENFLVIDAAAYPSKEAWTAAGRPTEATIPSQS